MIDIYGPLCMGPCAIWNTLSALRIWEKAHGFVFLMMCSAKKEQSHNYRTMYQYWYQSWKSTNLMNQLHQIYLKIANSTKIWGFPVVLGYMPQNHPSHETMVLVALKATVLGYHDVRKPWNLHIYSCSHPQTIAEANHQNHQIGRGLLSLLLHLLLDDYSCYTLHPWKYLHFNIWCFPPGLPKNDLHAAKCTAKAPGRHAPTEKRLKATNTCSQFINYKHTYIISTNINQHNCCVGWNFIHVFIVLNRNFSTANEEGWNWRKPVGFEQQTSGLTVDQLRPGPSKQPMTIQCLIIGHLLLLDKPRDSCLIRV